jgi:hypothetical protein
MVSLAPEGWRIQVDPTERQQLAMQIFTEMSKNSAEGSDVIPLWSDAASSEARLLNSAGGKEEYLHSVVLFCKALSIQGISGAVASIGAAAAEDAEVSFSSTDTERGAFEFDDEAAALQEARGRKRAAESQIVKMELDNLYECQNCQMKYSTKTGLTNHMHKCVQNMQWYCDWCECNWHQTNNRAPGPRGKSTLCNSCGAKYRRIGMAAEASCRQKTGSVVVVRVNSKPCRTNHVEENDYGRFDCATCHKQGADGFTSRAGLSNHLPKCAMLQAWRCAWCECDRKSLGKGSVGPGPDGKGTLCQSCAR